MASAGMRRSNAPAKSGALHRQRMPSAIKRLLLQNAAQMPTLDEIARDPVRASELSPPERIILIAQCAGVLLALSTTGGAPRQEPDPRQTHQGVSVERLLDV